MVTYKVCQLIIVDIVISDAVGIVTGDAKAIPPIIEIANLNTKYFVLSKVYTDRVI